MQGLLKYELSLWLIKEPSLPLLLAIDYLSHGRVSVLAIALKHFSFEPNQSRKFGLVLMLVGFVKGSRGEADNG